MPAVSGRYGVGNLPANVADGTIEVVGLVDIDNAALARGRQLLKLQEQSCFTDARRAFAEIEADFCTIVVPPKHHEALVDLAIARQLDILSEKPIADTMVASLQIAKNVKRAGLKMAVRISHRFDQDKSTLRALARSGRLGKLSVIAGRLASDFRLFDSWRRFRHEMAHPLLIEGAVHHLDIIADLAAAECVNVYARTWRPEWAQYQGDTDAVVLMEFANNIRGIYEGSASDPTGLNDWRYEYFRLDGEAGTAILNHREIELFTRVPEVRSRQRSRVGEGKPNGRGAQMGERSPDRTVCALARWRTDHRDGCREQFAFGHPRVCGGRERDHWKARRYW